MIDFADIPSKACNTCGAEKPLPEYYKHPNKPDGRQGKCKECHKSAMRRRHRDKMQDPEWVEAERERNRERMKEKYHEELKDDPEYWERHTEATRRWRNRNPEKYAAHVALNNAVRDGLVDKPNQCERCGVEDERLHGHHEDYSRPLDVEWLCALCHGSRHRTGDIGVVEA